MSVCIYYSTVLVYVTGLTMRKATGSDLRDLSDEERVSLAQHVRATKRLRKRRQS